MTHDWKPAMPRFSLDLGDGDALVLSERWTIEPLHRLIIKNLERLREWEPWAHGEQTVDGLAAFTKRQLHEWVDGRGLPAAIVSGGDVVASVGARIDPYAGVAELGYWVDVDAEGRGLVTRATQALITHLADEGGVRRFEIRAAVGNTRSRAVAERLGFTHEGTLRAAQVVGGVAQDVALYGLVPGTSDH